MSHSGILRRRHFVGHDGPNAFIVWTHHMAHYFSQRDYDKYEQCAVAITCFTDYALDWWTELEDERWYHRRPRVKTWGLLVYLMMRHFTPDADAQGVSDRTKEIMTEQRETQRFRRLLAESRARLAV